MLKGAPRSCPTRWTFSARRRSPGEPSAASSDERPGQARQRPVRRMRQADRARPALPRQRPVPRSDARVGVEHRPYLAHLRGTDFDTIIADRDAVQAMLDSPGWKLVEELLERRPTPTPPPACCSATPELTAPCSTQAEYARLLGLSVRAPPDPMGGGSLHRARRARAQQGGLDVRQRASRPRAAKRPPEGAAPATPETEHRRVRPSPTSIGSTSGWTRCPPSSSQMAEQLGQVYEPCPSRRRSSPSSTTRRAS